MGDFHVWDPKITTPPGLYAFATIFGNLARIRNCDVETLRWFSTIVLVFTSFYAGSCYTIIARYTGLKHPSVLHNALNIALFPPLFFFAGLFYTDVLSTCVVLKMYRDFLYNRSGIWLYLTGLLALTMRQTNIFWVAVFLGGLEVVRTLKTTEPLPRSNDSNSWKEIAKAAFNRYERGEIHDVPLCDAEIYGMYPPRFH
jgi:alpha-1,2-glucosyltransferase